MGKPRKKYTEEFKRDAVRMMRNRGTRTVAEVADDLGVGSNLLHRWASKTERDAVAKRNAEGETLEQEVRRLRKEVEGLRLDKAILKKAAATSTSQGNILCNFSSGEINSSVFRGRWLRRRAISFKSRWV